MNKVSRKTQKYMVFTLFITFAIASTFEAGSLNFFEKIILTCIAATVVPGINFLSSFMWRALFEPLYRKISNPTLKKAYIWSFGARVI